ncbi:hypothetical protein HOY80DRAFT_963220 [Tuber brumale]|nr:hypothetical protein HOY80DRAFT_963220 [Tuber brumale]
MLKMVVVIWGTALVLKSTRRLSRVLDRVPADRVNPFSMSQILAPEFLKFRPIIAVLSHSLAAIARIISHSRFEPSVYSLSEHHCPNLPVFSPELQCKVRQVPANNCLHRAARDR